MDEEQKQGFAERLQRIEAKKSVPLRSSGLSTALGDGDDMPPVPTEPDEMGGGGGGFGPIRMLLILLVLLAIGGVAGLYVADLARASKELAEETPIEVPTPSAEVVAPVHPLLAFTVPRAEPQDGGRRLMSKRGWDHTLGSVATPDGAQVLVTDIASGFDTRTARALPARVERFAPNATCTLRRPQAGEEVRNVRFDHAKAETDIHAFSNAALGETLFDHAQTVMFNPEADVPRQTVSGRLNQVDVFVTDRSAPIYLVLQTMSGNTLWNVHRGPGVTIAHIAMIGNTSAILPPKGVSFEALRISDFDLNFEFGAHDRPQECMIAPYRLPKPDWEASIKAQKGNTLFENQIYSFNAGHRAFAAWYDETLGADPETGLTEAESAAHALVGPVPPGLLGYRSVAGRTLHITDSDHVVLGDDALIQTHRDTVLAAAGTDPDRILPPVQRGAP
ncbi:MAG: hypothetical protein ACU0GG_07890 [Paracoccaceae bacterium]